VWIFVQGATGDFSKITTPLYLQCFARIPCIFIDHFSTLKGLVSCSYNDALSDVVIISITQSGTDQNKIEFCSDFTMDKEAAQVFFNQAKIMTTLEPKFRS